MSLRERPDARGGVGLHVQETREPAAIAAAKALRIAVFCDEQGVAAEAEIDGRDDAVDHLVAVRDEEVIGTCRLFVENGELIVQRVAVAVRARRDGVGRALMDAAAEWGRAHGATAIVLHAQLTAGPFYRALGYVEEGEMFLEEGIEHVQMRLPLAGRN